MEQELQQIIGVILESKSLSGDEKENLLATLRDGDVGTIHAALDSFLQRESAFVSERIDSLHEQASQIEDEMLDAAQRAAEGRQALINESKEKASVIKRGHSERTKRIEQGTEVAAAEDDQAAADAIRESLKKKG